MGEALLMRRGGVDTDNVTAASKDVLSGKIIVNADGEEVEGSLAPKFPNLLSDGSFETAAGDITKSAWQFGGRNTKDFSSICMDGAKSLSMYWSDGLPDYSMAYQYVNMVKDHKYYVSGWFLRSGDLTHDVNHIDIYGSVSGMVFFSITNKTVPEINTWTHLSNIMSVNAGGENMLRLIVRSRVNILCDAFSLIDLTEVFGSGNEPTKEEMDAIFRRIEWAGDNLYNLTQYGKLEASGMLSGLLGYAEGKLVRGTAKYLKDIAPDVDDEFYIRYAERCGVSNGYLTLSLNGMQNTFTGEVYGLGISLGDVPLQFTGTASALSSCPVEGVKNGTPDQNMKMYPYRIPLPDEIDSKPLTITIECDGAKGILSYMPVSRTYEYLCTYGNDVYSFYDVAPGWTECVLYLPTAGTASYRISQL